MSADNWRTCPRCEKTFVSQSDKQISVAKHQYGKIHFDAYNKLLIDAYAMPIDECPCTLREDYEQEMLNDGSYFVSYKCSCSVCGLSWSYRHEELVIK